jgi:predicted transcriptional regulator
MPPKPAPYAVDDELDEAVPLSEEELGAIKRAEADILAGRLHDHEDVAKWLRQQAKEIVERAYKRSKTP